MDWVTERLKLKDIIPEIKGAPKCKLNIDEIIEIYKLDEDTPFIRKAGMLRPKDTIIEEGERAAIRYITTADPDRDGEIVVPSGGILSEFEKSKSVLYAHNYSMLPVGRDQWVKLVKQKGILAKTEYATHSFANDLYECVKGGFVNTNSIGFIPLEWEDYEEKKSSPLNKRDTNVKRKYTKWELLEYSGVMIGSNRQALTLMVKKGLIKDDKLKKDIEDFIEEEKIQRGIKLNKELDEEYDDFTYGVKKTQYKCTCIKCGWEHTSDKHCNTYKCEKCGGTMRRSSRPGPGQESETEENESAKEVILKPEETDDFIRIPVRDCKVTATITISAKEGITALYCGKIKKIRTYIFSKKEPYRKVSDRTSDSKCIFIKGCLR